MSGASTGGFQPLAAVTPPQAQDPQTGSVALFGVPATLEDLRDQVTGCWAGLLRPSDDA